MGKDAMSLDENMRTKTINRDGIDWHSPLQAPFQLYGFPWIEQEGLYRRLPAAPAHPIREAVDSLANCTAGGQIRFRTDAPKLLLSVKLAAPANMPHMPATGQCGFDCYAGTGAKAQYVSTTTFPVQAAEFESLLFEGFDRKMRDITLNFPLYQGVKEVWVGVPEGSSLEGPKPFDSAGKIVFYGTSITQGGCASRPGMAFPNIISRRLNRECVNLGFSGNGKGEPELARIIREIADMELLVLDYVPNVSAEEYRATLPVFIDLIREQHPKLPILVVSSIRYAKAAFLKQLRDKQDECRDFSEQTVAARREAGDGHIAFLDGYKLLGRRYDECTVDGSHPTDLGFMRMAKKMLGPIRSLL